MSRTLSCFVINPMGQPGDTDRLQTEAIWRNILRPAFDIFEQRSGHKVEAVPEYENHAARDISDELVDHVINDDVLIALIHGKHAHDVNPNVMYEVGIAHSAGRNDLIILSDDAQVKAKKIFDIGTRFQYTYSSKDLLPGSVPLNVIQDVVKALEANVAKSGNVRATRVAFGDRKLDALGHRHSEYHLIAKFNGDDPYDNLPFTEWARFFHNTEKTIDIMGVSLNGLLGPDSNWVTKSGESVSFSKFLKAKALLDGVNVRLIIMHEENPALPQMLHGVVSGGQPRKHDLVRYEIEDATKQWLALAEDVERDKVLANSSSAGSIELIKLRRGIINERVSLTDRGIIVTPIFLHVERNGVGPALWAAHTTTVYSFFKDHMKFLMDNATQPAGDSVPQPAARSG
jgi:hypothetical protein